MKFILSAFAFVAFSTAFAQDAATAQLNARLMQMPSVSRELIAFTYGGDIWIVPRAGGNATRLSSPRGSEMFPRFSPDGQLLAFTGNYEGNEDIYVMPVTGGEPRRVTHHSSNDRLLGWYPDGKSLLFASGMTTFSDRVHQFYKVSALGGLPERLPIPYGEFGAISPDGKRLAYTPITTDFATWKRYRGGMAPDIWLFDLEQKSAERIAPNPANDSQPMWHDNKLYFLSDRDEKARDNIWVYDTATRVVRQVTHYTDYDVHFPSIGPDAIVFEYGGRLSLLDLATDQSKQVEITVVTDETTLRPRVENVANMIRNGSISPTGKRALFEARGEIFSVPAEFGVVRNITESSGVAERYPAWSPDGKWVAYFSDRSGEYELTLRPADGKGAEQTITQLGPGYRYQPQWSPDAKKIVFIDSAMRIWMCDVEAKKVEQIDRELWMYQGALENFGVSWSKDSRWIAYAGDLEHEQSAIMLYDTAEKKRHQATSGFFDDDLPAFDPDGKYLYYRSKRFFDPIYSEYEPSWIYANGQALVAVSLRKDVPSPLSPRNDEEPAPKEEPKKEDPKKDTPKPEEPPAPEKKEEPKQEAPRQGTVAIEEKKTTEAKPAEPSKPSDKPADKPEDKKKGLEIDLDGFEGRAVVLPPGGGRFGTIFALPGKVFFTRLPRVGSNTGTRPLSFYDLEKREEKQVLDDVGAIDISADAKKLLVSRGGTWAIVNAAENQNFNKSLATNPLEMSIKPREEWRQLFTDAWRIERDFFYDPGLHGVDWKGMRERYGKLIDEAVTRSDVNFVIGELIGELSVSHTYRSGGEIEGGPSRNVGYLGCDFALDQGAYRIAKIPEVAAWEYTVRSPLRGPGVNVKEGDWLLAVNGGRLDVAKDPWAAFQGLADKTVILTVNDKPTMEGAREVLVQTIGSETWLRHYAWMEDNRQRVDKLSSGKIGYIYVRDTGQEGQNQLYRQFRAQYTKPGLIIDERWNAGGQIPDRFIELLARKVTNYWGVRDGHDWQTPPLAHPGPQAMLANGWSGSGGDCFPWLFRENKLGPIIGTRTWGGLIGMTGSPRLIDGGNVTVPTFGIYDRNGKWIIEGHGVDPDIEVLDDPAAMSKGADPQLERAVDEVLKSLGAQPVATPKKPAYPNRAGS